MTINDVKRQLVGLTKAQKVDKALLLIEEFLKESNVILVALKESPDTVSFFSMSVTGILNAAVIADGCLNHSKYEAYVKMSNALSCAPVKYEMLEMTIPLRFIAIERCSVIAEQLKNVYAVPNLLDTLDKFVLALACLMGSEGEFEDNELRLLANFFRNNDEPDIVIIQSSGGSTSFHNGKYYVSFGAVLRNPKKTLYARNVHVEITIKDASESIIASSQRTIEYIDPDALFFFGDEFAVDRGEPSNFEVTASCSEFVDAPENSRFSDGISCFNYELSKGDFGERVFFGNVQNGYSKKLRATLFFVFYDSTGKITGGTNTTITLNDKATERFECYISCSFNIDKVCFSPGYDFMKLIDGQI